MSFTIIKTKEYVDFIVGRNGEFDILSASVVHKTKKALNYNNCSLTLCLPYKTAEYSKNSEYFYEFYDEIEICEKAAQSHYKSAIQIRNRSIVDRSDLIICCIERNNGGAYKTVQYAKNLRKEIINISEL